MSEVFNYNPEMVSADELGVLADYYTQKIHEVTDTIRRLPNGSHGNDEWKRLRKELFRLYNRRYYLRICHRARYNKQN